MTDEEYVRSKWESCDVEDHRLCCGSDSWRAVLEPAWSSFFPTISSAWSAAAAFIRAREKQIQQIEEEILWIESESTMSDGYPYPEALRILAREQAALDDLKRGMK